MRLARFNITPHDSDSTWKENFFEGVPSPAGAGLVLLPLVFYKAEIYNLDEYKLLITSLFFVVTSILMISKIPTYSMKRITIPRRATIFLLFGIGLYFGLVFFYTFKVLFISGIIYIFTIPISFINFKKNKNKEKILKQVQDVDETEDVL